VCVCCLKFDSKIIIDSTAPEDVIKAGGYEEYNREIVEQEGEDRYIDWQRKMDSLSRIFKTELNLLDDNFQANFTSVNGQHPFIMTMYLQKKISLETLSIIAKISNIFPYWEKEIVDKIVARDIIRLIKKYKPFLEIDEKKFKDIVRERFF
jgi:hypothetical protein